MCIAALDKIQNSYVVLSRSLFQINMNTKQKKTNLRTLELRCKKGMAITK